VCLAKWYVEVAFLYGKATSTNQFARHTDGQQTLHKPNGSIKQQLKIPPMMGLRRPETCRVREDI
jgi:hypothetical protein